MEVEVGLVSEFWVVGFFCLFGGIFFWGGVVFVGWFGFLLILLLGFFSNFGGSGSLWVFGLFF